VVVRNITVGVALRGFEKERNDNCTTDGLVGGACGRWHLEPPAKATSVQTKGQLMLPTKFSPKVDEKATKGALVLAATTNQPLLRSHRKQMRVLL